jgi:hypothetical protein
MSRALVHLMSRARRHSCQGHSSTCIIGCFQAAGQDGRVQLLKGAQRGSKEGGWGWVGGIGRHGVDANLERV